MGKMKNLLMENIEGNEALMNGFAEYQFEQALEHIFLDGLGLLVQKHQDYGPKNISQSPGGPLNGLRVRMWDKLARINNLVDNGAEPEYESLRDSFIDLMNYSAIAIMVLDGEWPED
ncbi:Clostridium phage phiCTP1, Gp74 [uncultured Caudovirales phage]|uniref:Clostridium phage phiCTP1, Gp74 n=1 Tax=uncultured Caudovirales phage TaxID=2100421 RepID=A0A6J5L6B9_9CAUD|nr:Clostridium phage phiCTP1, Gp74 [uncultured Caudovirales phage]